MIIHSPAFIVFLLIIIPTLQSCNNLPSCFSPRIFGFGLPSQGFYNVKLHDNNQSYTIKNYADFNQDMAADYIALTQSNKALIYLWSKDEYSFNKKYQIAIQQTCIAKSIYLFDLNYDGVLDFTVWGTNPQKTTNCIIPYINKQLQFTPVTSAKLILLPTADPIYFSHRSNNLDNTGLLVFLNGSRTILHFDNDLYKPLIWDAIFITKGYHDIKFKQRHWNAFLDLTGDCLPDLILFDQKGKIQFWINKRQNFQLQTELSLSQITSYTSFDINSDGGIDLIFSNKSSLLVYTNINTMQSQSQFCDSSRNKLPFNLKEIPLVIHLFDNKTQIQTQTIHYGDMNIDGFPDLAFIADNLVDKTSTPYVFLYTGDFNNIQYSQQQKYNSLLKSTFSNMKVLSISFFDILENGQIQNYYRIVDIFVNAQSQGGNKFLYGLYNHYLYQNSFFIKGSALLGPNSDVGCLLPGATFFWIDNIIDGTVRVAALSQYSQTAYDALQMPYVVNGLGKINDYVKFFTVSNYYQKRSWSTIIPNSQLSIYTTNGDPDDWSIKIYVLPNQSIVVVIAISAFFLIIIGAVIFYFKYKNHVEQQKKAPIDLDLIG